MGRKPDRAETRAAWAVNRNYMALRGILRTDDSTILQPQGYRMDQKALPDCVGKSFQGRINALLGQDPSGVNLWIECRAYDGSLNNANEGTTAESAIQVLTNLGWMQRTNPKEDDLSPDDPSLIEVPSLESYLAGYDNRIVAMNPDTFTGHGRRSIARDIAKQPVASNHEVVTGSDDEIHFAILDALREVDNEGNFRNAVVFGTGVFAKYFNPPKNTVLDEKYLSANGNQGGHEQGIIGWSAERQGYIIAGSWDDWTECTVPVGDTEVRLIGCCLVSRAVVEHAWDVDKLQLR